MREPSYPRATALKATPAHFCYHNQDRRGRFKLGPLLNAPLGLNCRAAPRLPAPTTTRVESRAVDAVTSPQWRSPAERRHVARSARSSNLDFTAPAGEPLDVNSINPVKMGRSATSGSGFNPFAK